MDRVGMWWMCNGFFFRRPPVQLLLRIPFPLFVLTCMCVRISVSALSLRMVPQPVTKTVERRVEVPVDVPFTVVCLWEIRSCGDLPTRT